MRKLFATIVLTTISAIMFAEGYQVNVQSAKQAGMGHVGTAMKLGAESMHFNPAAMAFMADQTQVSLGMGGIKAVGKYTSGDYSAKTDNDWSTPVYGYFGYKISDRLAAGVDLTVPYGNGINWGDDWAGAHLVQSMSLKVFNVQPTVSYRITDRLSLGAGFQVMFGSVDMSSAILPVGYGKTIAGLISQAAPQYNQQGQYLSSVNGPLASANMTGKSKVSYGFNVGVMYDLSSKVTIGVSYRSKSKLKLDSGEAEMNFADQQTQQIITALGTAMPSMALPDLEKGNFTAELPLPSNTTLGISYRPTSKWEISADLQYIGWKAYDKLELQFPEAKEGGYTISSKKNYHNAFAYRVGAQYKICDRFIARLGAYYDCSPVDSDYVSPESPSQDKRSLTAGFTATPNDWFEFTIGYNYINGKKRTASCADRFGTNGTFGGTYKVTANTMAFSLGFKF